MNSFGSIFKVTSFGESHSAMVGCVVEGVPAGLLLDLEKIQLAVDKQKQIKPIFHLQEMKKM